MKEEYWRIFLGLGTVESYLIYRLMEKQGEKDGGGQNTGIDTEF